MDFEKCKISCIDFFGENPCHIDVSAESVFVWVPEVLDGFRSFYVLTGGAGNPGGFRKMQNSTVCFKTSKTLVVFMF